MWCKHCRQDVPGIICAESGEYRCPRCAEGIYSPLSDPLIGIEGFFPVDGNGVEEEPGARPPRLYDDWELDDELEHVGRILSREKPKAGLGVKSAGARVDAAHAGVAGTHSQRKKARQADAHRQAPAGQTVAEDAFSLMALVTWTLLSLGLMTFVCGGVLLGWSSISSRPDLWNMGLPTTLGGLVALLIGLILQLDRLWHDYRRTAVTLERFDEDLCDLKTTTTTVLDASHTVSGADFYAHLAGGAGPQLLLTDLKSQLDLLSAKIGKTD